VSAEEKGSVSASGRRGSPHPSTPRQHPSTVYFTPFPRKSRGSSAEVKQHKKRADATQAPPSQPGDPRPRKWPPPGRPRPRQAGPQTSRTMAAGATCASGGRAAVAASCRRRLIFKASSNIIGRDTAIASIDAYVSFNVFSCHILQHSRAHKLLSRCGRGRRKAHELSANIVCNMCEPWAAEENTNFNYCINRFKNLAGGRPRK
jgi:hypothetical protein